MNLNKWSVALWLNRQLDRAYRLVPGGFKKRKQRWDRPMYLRILRETEQYSLLVRVASAIHRDGYSSAQAFSQLHKDDWSLSNRVMAELERIENGKNGYDPARVPPILPVYLVPTQSRPHAPKSLPVNAVQPKVGRVPDARSEVVATVVKSDVFDPPVKKITANVLHTVRMYYVHDGVDWVIYRSAVLAKQAMDNLKKSILGKITNALVLPERLHRSTCTICKGPLHGEILSVPTYTGSKKFNHLHLNCYWFKHVDICRIPLNMVILNPADGLSYIWQGPLKGGWIKYDCKTLTGPVSTAPAAADSKSAHVSGRSQSESACATADSK